jgi:hypothetical protein
MTPEELKAEILEEREYLSHKIEALSGSVQASVAQVKDKVENIKKRVSPSGVVKRYPFFFVATAVTTGFLLSRRSKKNVSYLPQHLSSFQDDSNPSMTPRSSWLSAIHAAIPLATALVALKRDPTSVKEEMKIDGKYSYILPFAAWGIDSLSKALSSKFIVKKDVSP